jgi:hypothetical protein
LIFKSFLSKSWKHMELFWGFSLLLPCCHQMELTSGCYTVLCHCAYAQNMLTAKLQTRTGSETGVPPHADCTSCLPFLALATRNANGHKGKRARPPHRCGINFKLQSTSDLVISWLFSLENLWPHQPPSWCSPSPSLGLLSGSTACLSQGLEKPV